MTRMKSLFNMFAVFVVLLACSTLAQAQATRTWVSGVGDDANPCSRTAPCKTFAGAISKTATGGEISVLDPGGFGAVTIGKGITINGTGTLAGILNSLGVNGIVVNAPATDTVIIREISINGAGTGANGVSASGANTQFNIDDTTIAHCTTTGLRSSAGDSIRVSDSMIANNNTGINPNGGAIDSFQGNSLMGNPTPGSFSSTTNKQ